MDFHKKFLLINPATKEAKQLPSIPNLGFSVFYPLFGVGYDSVNDEYKVVVLSLEEMFVDVYSVSNGMWKRVEFPPNYLFHTQMESGVYLDGYIHWVATRVSDSFVVIAAFDLHEEKFCEVPRPSLMSNAKEMDLVMFGGCLGIRSYMSKSEVYLWKMKEYGVEESWTNFFVINPYGRSMIPVCFMGKEKVLLHQWPGPDAESPDPVLCNLEGGAFKNIVVNGIKEEYFVQGIFIESDFPSL